MFLSLILFVSFLYSFEVSFLFDKKDSYSYYCQYLYDLKKLDNILEDLNKSKDFRSCSVSLEKSYKNEYSQYSIGYINVLLQILRGEKGKGGYIKYIEDKFAKNLICKNNLIIKDFDAINKRLEKKLSSLKKLGCSKENLKGIFYNLILSLEEIKVETKLLNIPPFNYLVDKKYNLPVKWAQIDGNTTFADVVNFILDGGEFYLDGYPIKIYGLKDYYKVYKGDN